MSMTIKSNDYVVTPEMMFETYSEFCKVVNTPFARKALEIISSDNHDELTTLKVDPRDYTCAEAFRDDYQVASMLRKADFLKTSFNKEARAKAKFLEAEEKCKRTNTVFRYISESAGDASLNRIDPKIRSQLDLARRLISRILGKVPDELRFRFGPGVNSHVKKDVTGPKKYCHKIGMTSGLFNALPSILGPHWMSSLTEVEPIKGGTIAFVPKDATILRTILIGAHVNGYVQLGIGQEMRRKLLPYIDLSKGQERNRHLASIAHTSGLSTMDLSMASDTICSALVWYLLPQEWAVLCEDARERWYRFQDSDGWFEFEKFSSMGNGFTFELESLIFYCLARAAGGSKELTSVYGDDIILEREHYDALEELLEFCGFSVNKAKSFKDGSFFESCGADFFNGVNVRPFFVKALKPSTWFVTLNALSRFSARYHYRDIKFYTCWKFLYDAPRALFGKRVNDLYKCVVPIGRESDGVITCFDEAVPHIMPLKDGHCGFSTRALKYRQLTKDYSTELCGYLYQLDRPVNHVSNFLGNIDEPTLSRETTIRQKGYYQVGRTIVFGQWNGYGPWL